MAGFTRDWLNFPAHRLISRHRAGDGGLYYHIFFLIRKSSPSGVLVDLCEEVSEFFY